MIKKSVLLLVFLLFSLPFLFATVTLSTLELVGSILPKSLVDISQIVGGSPQDAIPLDSGDILFSESGNGVKVGTWAVSSNSNAVLSLYISYGPFEDDSTLVPYTVYNGSNWVDSEAKFIDLIPNELGVYSADDNNGPIYIKRVDNNSYPPSNNYKTTISFTLESP